MWDGSSSLKGLESSQTSSSVYIRKMFVDLLILRQLIQPIGEREKKRKRKKRKRKTKVKWKKNKKKKKKERKEKNKNKKENWARISCKQHPECLKFWHMQMFLCRGIFLVSGLFVVSCKHHIYIVLYFWKSLLHELGILPNEDKTQH